MIHKQQETVILVTSFLYFPYSISAVHLRKHMLTGNANNGLIADFPPLDSIVFDINLDKR